ncbi:MAG: efflux RND transporter periplasmic adaptor subunit [Desulfobaccales bacterium]
MRQPIRILGVFLSLLGALAPLPVMVPFAAGAAELTFTGKLLCSLKRPVILPVAGQLTSLEVQPGQKVTEGEVLGRYQLLPESIQTLRRRLSPAQIPEMRAKLAELDKNLTILKNKQKSLRELTLQKLAAPQSLEQVEQEIKALSRQRAALAEALGQAQDTRLEEEALVRKQLGVPFKSGQVPQQGVLVAPISGHVLWLHPDLRPGAELPGNTPIITVGVMDPMLLRARVHEIEALKLKVGDEADITLESLPDRKFKARVNRLPWAPMALSLEIPTYYDVEFEVPNPDLVLKEGLKATLEIRAPGDRNQETAPKK